MRDFEPGLCLRIHFYTGWQFFLFLLCPLRLRYDWRCQRFSRFPNANTNSNFHTNCNRNANRDGNCHSDDNSKCHGYANRDSNCNYNAKWDTNSYSKCHRHRNADPYTSRVSTCANTAASPDTSASPINC